MKTQYGKDGKFEIGPFERMIAGSTAGIISQTSIYPMEVILHTLCY